MWLSSRNTCGDNYKTRSSNADFLFQLDRQMQSDFNPLRKQARLIYFRRCEWSIWSRPWKLYRKSCVIFWLQSRGALQGLDICINCVLNVWSTLSRLTGVFMFALPVEASLVINTVMNIPARLLLPLSSSPNPQNSKLLEVNSHDAAQSLQIGVPIKSACSGRTNTQARTSL